MRRVGRTKLAIATIEEMRDLLTKPVEKKENEISFGEFMSAYNPKNEEHNFTYPIPDTRSFLSLQIYDILRNPYVVLKLDHALLYKEGHQLEFCFDPTGNGNSIQSPNRFLKEEIWKLQNEVIDHVYTYYPPKKWEQYWKLFSERERFRKEYFPKSILEEVERQKSLGQKKI